MGEGRVRPFSNGSMYLDYLSENCDRCAKNYDPDRDVNGESPCPLETEMSLACIGDGTISAATAVKLGIKTTWRCIEFVPIGSAVEAPRRPLAGQLGLFDGEGVGL